MAEYHWQPTPTTGTPIADYRRQLTPTPGPPIADYRRQPTPSAGTPIADYQENPDILTSGTNLALTFGDQGRLKEAEELYVKVVE